MQMQTETHTGQQVQLDENGDVVATIEGHLSHHDLQQAEAEAIDDENAAILHDDQQPLTSSFTGHHNHMPPTLCRLGDDRVYAVQGR